MSAAKIVVKMNDWQPAFVAAHPSFARLLPEEQLKGHLRIAPEQIRCAGEVLSPETRADIEAAFGRVIYDYYGTSEPGVMAARCVSTTLRQSETKFTEYCRLSVVVC